MIFPPELIPELVPQELPPEFSVSPAQREAASSLEGEIFQRSYLWSAALTNYGLSNPPPCPSRLQAFSTGFVYVTEENAEKNSWMRTMYGFSYGVNILVETSESAPQEIVPIEFPNYTFPLVINFGEIEEHSLPTHPHSGTGACWIENRKSTGIWENGILTCRHTVKSFPKRAIVSLHPRNQITTPTQGFLADKTSCTIDAAIIGVRSKDWPSGLTQKTVVNPVSPGSQLSFDGRTSKGSGTVLRVFQHAPYIGNLFGQRVFTDCFGQGGDSGSLVVEAQSGRGIGIYIGAVPDGAGGYEGICQHLGQAEHYFDFDVFV